MKFCESIIFVLLYLFTGNSVVNSDDKLKYYYYTNVSAIDAIINNSNNPVEYNFKSEIEDNVEHGLKSAGNYARTIDNLFNVTANLKNYLGQVCKNINTTRLLTTVRLPNVTAERLSTTVELTNGKLMDVKSIAPYNDCPGFYGNDSYTLETRMLVDEFKVSYDCKLTVLWTISTNFKVAAFVNDMKVDSKFIFNATDFEVKLDYIDIPKGTKIKVDIEKEGALSYVFNQFLSFVFYITETSILNNAQDSAKNFIEDKLKELPKLNNTKPQLPQLKCFGFWLINS